MAVNKGLELLRDPERGGVAAVGVVFSFLGTDFKISEICRGLIVTTNLKIRHKLFSQVINCGHTGRLGQFVEQVFNHFSKPGLHIQYFFFYSIRMQ